MAKFTYLKYDIRGNYVEFDQKFDETLYNNIGTTWEDYVKNKWVLLSDEQASFHKANPTASVYEVWSMTLVPTPTRTIDNAKNEMIGNIDAYDNSQNVNAFIVKVPSESEDAKEGYLEMKAWLTQQERSNYRSSIDSAKLLGVDSLSLYISGMPLTLPTATAETMLAQIQLYADQCYIVTKQHKDEVYALQTIEEVDSYDYQNGYPEMLVFTV
jgi:hypothetical protein